MLAPALLASIAVARADAVSALQGAWVMDHTKCTAVFEKAGGKTRFKDRTFASEHGFIITGKRVLGPIAGCTISPVERDNDRVSVDLACADALVSKKFSMTFRVIDATHFERLDRFKDFTIKYKKCSL